MKSESEIQHEMELMREMRDGASKQAAMMLEAKIQQLKWVLDEDD